MNIRAEAKEKAKILLNKILFFPFCFLMAILLSYANYDAFKFSAFLMFFVYCLIAFCIPYFILRSLIIKPFEKYYQKKLNKEYAIIQMEQENYLYNRDFKREFEKKRAELALEFEHYKKIALLNAQTDQAKMLLIHQLEQQFYDRQNSDLNSLNAQIERLKKEL